MLADGHLLLVLHQVPRPGDRTRTGVFYWRKPDGGWVFSGGYGVKALFRHLEEYTAAEESFARDYERAQTAEDYFEILEGMLPLRLATQNLHATLQSAREGIPQDKDIIDLRDWAYDIERTLDLLYENAKNALDYKIAQRVEEQSQWSMRSVEAGHRLNVLAAIFFPLTAVSCLFGMNVVSGLENSSFLTFWFITLGAFGLGLMVRRWVTSGKWG